MHHCSKVVLVICALLLAVGTAWGQGAVGTLNGTVLDAAGAVVPGAAVMAVNIATGVESKTTSTSAGSYTLPYLQAGTYTIKVTAPGFRTASAENVILRAAQTLTVNISLEIGQLSEQVTVSATPPLLESGTAEIGRYISEAGVQELADPRRRRPAPDSGVHLQQPSWHHGRHVRRLDQRRAAVLARDSDRGHSGRPLGPLRRQQQRVQPVGGSHRRIQTADRRDRRPVQRRPDGGGQLQHQVRHQRPARLRLLYLQNEALNATPSPTKTNGRKESQVPRRQLGLLGRRSGLHSEDLQRQEQDVLLHQLRERPLQRVGHERVHARCPAPISRMAISPGCSTRPTRATPFGSRRTRAETWYDALGRPVIFGQIYDPNSTRTLPTAQSSAIRSRATSFPKPIRIRWPRTVLESGRCPTRPTTR